MPPLDSYLAAPCKTIDPTLVLDYDQWDDETARWLLEVAADCAARHLKTVQAWPRNSPE